MPPKNTRKRRNPSPEAVERPAKRVGRGGASKAAPNHEISGSRPARKSAKELQDIVNNINQTAQISSEESSSDESFEDVPIAGPAEDDDEEEMEWEDAMDSGANLGSMTERPQPVISDLNITLAQQNDLPDYSSMSGGKKGPAKFERAIRVDTHGMHVLGLMWHNTIRNSWCNDQEVKDVLLTGLSEGLKAEIEKWRVASGLKSSDEPATSHEKKKARGKKAKKSKDWSSEAERQERGKPDLSRGDPLIHLLKHLSAYWKKRWQITAPGLRKRGYQPLKELGEHIKAYDKNPDEPSRFGERISSREEFRKAAKQHCGSRDLGAQLFTALLRAIGLEARLVVSLQPTGFGWSKVEEAKEKKFQLESGNVSTAGSSKSTRSTDVISAKKSTATPAELDTSSSEMSDPLSDSELDVPRSVSTPNKGKKQFDKDLPFPTYWTEVLSTVTRTYYAVSTLLTPHVATNSEGFEKFEPRGAAADRAKQVICYVMAYSSDGTAKDVTVRYLKRRQLPGRTKGFRLPSEKIPVYNRRGTKIVKHVQSDWFKRVLRIYARPGIRRTRADKIEDEGDLVPFKPEKAAKEAGSTPETLQAYKASPEFVLQIHLRREEAIVPAAKVVKEFTYGKGEKEKTEPVYLRKDIVLCKTVESWHKEGREVKIGSQPLKMVPTRAVTLARKQEVEHAIRQTGEKPLQGLYSRAQTQWIIPAPIKDGKIPKNAYGNIDVYVPSMVPKGAVHIPHSGTKKVCNKLGIDFAEACTGFEFGHQMAVPVITGVVVAEEHEEAVVELWEEEEEKKRRREDEKREKKLLGLWRKFVVGLNIMERVRKEYGEDGVVPDAANPFIRSHKGDSGPSHQAKSKTKQEPKEEDEHNDFEQHAGDHGGGFLPEGMEYMEPQNSHLEIHMGSQQEGDRKSTTKHTGVGPMSLRTAHRKPTEDDPIEEEVDEALSDIDTSDLQSDGDEINGQALATEDPDESDPGDEDSDLSDLEYPGFADKKLPAKETRRRSVRSRK